MATEAHISGRRTSVGTFGGTCPDCAPDWSHSCYLHLRFEAPDAVGNDGFTDSSGYENHAVSRFLDGATTFPTTAGQYWEGARSLKLPASGNRTFDFAYDTVGRVTGRRSNLLNYAPATFTFSLALRIDTLPSGYDQKVINNNGVFNEAYRMLLKSTGALQWIQTSGGDQLTGVSVTSSTTLSTGVFHAVQFVYDGENGLGRIYIDGAVTGTLVAAFPPTYFAESAFNGFGIGDGNGSAQPIYLDDFAYCDGAFDTLSARRAAACAMNGSLCHCSLANPTQYSSAPKHEDFGGTVTGGMPPCNQAAPTYLNGGPAPFSFNNGTQIAADGGGSWTFDITDGDPDGLRVDGTLHDRTGRGNDLDANNLWSNFVATGVEQGRTKDTGASDDTDVSYCQTANGTVCAHPEDFTTNLEAFSFGMLAQSGAVSADHDLIFTEHDPATDGGFRFYVKEASPTDLMRIEMKTAAGLKYCETPVIDNGMTNWQVRFTGEALSIWANGTLKCNVDSGPPLDATTGVFTVNNFWPVDDVWFSRYDLTEGTLRRIAACNVDGMACRCFYGSPGPNAYLSMARSDTTPWTYKMNVAGVPGCSAGIEYLGSTVATTTSTSTSTSTSSSSTTTSTSSTTTSTV